MRIIEILAVLTAAVTIPPIIVWTAMSLWYRWQHGKHEKTIAPTSFQVQAAFDMGIARSERTCRVADRCTPRA